MQQTISQTMFYIRRYTLSLSNCIHRNTVIRICIFIRDMHFQAMLHLVQEVMGVNNTLILVPVSENISPVEFVTSM